jgi:hypothetical protein
MLPLACRFSGSVILLWAHLKTAFFIKNKIGKSGFSLESAPKETSEKMFLEVSLLQKTRVMSYLLYYKHFFKFYGRA